MRPLWRTTTDLFWQHLVLWLPVVTADLLAFCLRSFQTWTTQALIQNVVAGHSVLSSTPDQIQSLPAVWAVLFGATRALVELLNVCLYTAAMISISILVPALIAQIALPWREIPFALGRHFLRILLFSLKALLLIAVAGILDIGLITYLLPHFNLVVHSIRISTGQNMVIIAVFFAAVGWLLAPGAVAMLRPREASPVAAIELGYARIFAALSILSSVAVYFVFTVIKQSFAPLLTEPIEIQVFWAIASATSAVPYVPLFIALSLIANQDPNPAILPTVDPAPQVFPPDL